MFRDPFRSRMLQRRRATQKSRKHEHKVHERISSSPPVAVAAGPSSLLLFSRNFISSIFCHTIYSSSTNWFILCYRSENGPSSHARDRRPQQPVPFCNAEGARPSLSFPHKYSRRVGWACTQNKTFLFFRILHKHSKVLKKVRLHPTYNNSLQERSDLLNWKLENPFPPCSSLNPQLLNGNTNI